MKKAIVDVKLFSGPACGAFYWLAEGCELSIKTPASGAAIASDKNSVSKFGVGGSVFPSFPGIFECIIVKLLTLFMSLSINSFTIEHAFSMRYRAWRTRFPGFSG
jgi:hypothetical protein